MQDKSVLRPISWSHSKLAVGVFLKAMTCSESASTKAYLTMLPNINKGLSSPASFGLLYPGVNVHGWFESRLAMARGIISGPT